MTLLYDGYAGALATLDGTTVTVAAFTSSYIPSTVDATLAAIDTNEVDVGDATGYVRDTVDVTWTPSTRRLTFDTAPTFDLDGASDVQHFVVADAGGDLVCVLSYDVPFTGVDGFTLDPDSVAAEADQAGLEARVSALEANPGGGVQSVVAGANVTVDNSDPAYPVVSASAEWDVEDDGANLATFALGDTVRRVQASWMGGDTPVVAPASGPAPVMLGVVQAAHRPAATIQGRAGWTTSPPAAGDLVWIVDHDGSTLGTAGGLWVMDLSGTLTDTDDVMPDLSTVEWWLT